MLDTLEAKVGLMARFEQRLKHVAAKIATLTIGAMVVSAPVEAWRQRRNRRRPLPVFLGRAALVAHIFYDELLGEVLACHANLPSGSALIVTSPPEVAEALRLRLAGMENALVVACPNRGRDIAPFLALLDAGVLARFDAVLKLHSKRSPHLRDGDIRRKLLFLMLAGSRRRVGQVLAMFEQPRTGLVGWRASWRASPLFWMRNRPNVAKLCARMGLAMPLAPAFFEGSMFWLRPAALARLTGLGLTAEDFEAEAGQTDGTLHHAVERTFAPAAAAEGFDIADVQGRRLLGGAC